MIEECGGNTMKFGMRKPSIKRGIIRMCERVAASGGTPTPYSA